MTGGPAGAAPVTGGPAGPARRAEPRRAVLAGPTRRAVLAAAVAAAAAGCVRIPDSGAVHRRPRASAGAVAPEIRTFPSPPVAGAAPQAVAAGFLEACAVSGPDYSTARSYLTTAAGERWDPTVGLTVFSATSWRGSGVLPPGALTTSVVLTGTWVGRVDQAGTFTAAAATAPYRVRLTLRREDGQWRIGNPPAGLLLSDDDFAREYTAWQVLFVNPAGTSTVPDAVYLPDRGTDAAQLVQRLVAGPSDWLAPAVRSALPGGTQLAVAAVPVAEGVATVDLTAPARDLDDTARVLLSAQVVTTLRQLQPAVSAVSIVSGGASLRPRQVPADQPVDSWDQYNPDVLTAAGGDLTVLAVQRGRPLLVRGEPGSLSEVRGVTPELFTGGLPRSIAVDPPTGRLAVVRADGRAVVVAPAPGTAGAARRVLSGTDLSRPQFDRAGLVWAVDATGAVLVWDGRGVRTVAVDLRALQIASPGPGLVPGLGLVPGTRVRRLTLSRDGQRAAVVVGAGRAAGTVLLMRVRRDGPLRLDAPRLVTTAYPVVHDVAWLDADQLVLLARDATSTLQVVQLRQDGSAVQPLGTPPSGVTVAAGPGDRGIVVGGSDGSLYVRPIPLPPRWTPVVATPTPAPSPSGRPAAAVPSPTAPTALVPTAAVPPALVPPSPVPSGPVPNSGVPTGAAPTIAPVQLAAPVYPG